MPARDRTSSRLTLKPTTKRMTVATAATTPKRIANTKPVRTPTRRPHATRRGRPKPDQVGIAHLSALLRQRQRRRRDRFAPSAQLPPPLCPGVANPQRQSHTKGQGNQYDCRKCRDDVDHVRRALRHECHPRRHAACGGCPTIGKTVDWYRGAERRFVRGRVAAPGVPTARVALAEHQPTRGACAHPDPALAALGRRTGTDETRGSGGDERSRSR